MTNLLVEDRAIEELQRVAESPEHALAVLDAIEKKRKEESFIRYWEPFEYERKVFDAFGPEVKILVVCGGNRSGKTEVGSAITIAWGEGKDYFRGEKAWSWVGKLPIPEKRSRNIWIVGLDFPNHLNAVIWREKLMTGMNHPGFCPKDGTVSNIRNDDKQIFFGNSSVISGKSADSGREKFQSASVDLVWIDEECDAEIFDECYQRTIDCGGRIVVTVTPLTDISSGVKTPWIFDLYEAMKGGRKDIKFVYLSMLDNPTIPEQEKEAAKKKWAGHPEERARLYGEFVRRSGLVYPMWDRKIHLVRPFKTNPTRTHIVTIDPAATGITAALWAEIDADSNILLYKEYYEGNLTVGEHSQRILTLNTDKIDRWLIDPKWASQRNAETHKTGAQLYREAGIPVIPPNVGEDYGLEVSKEYLQASVDAAARSKHPKVYVSSDLSNFIFEVEHYTWDMFQKGNLKGLSKDKPIKKNDHLLNAFQYLCATKPRPGWRTERVFSDAEMRERANRNSYF